MQQNIRIESLTAHDSVMRELYGTWCVAAFNADNIYDELEEDFTHPAFVEAEKISRNALFAFLRHNTSSLPYILLKLQVASDVEDYFTDALNADCTFVAPRAVVGAIEDLKYVVDSLCIETWE